MDRETDFRCLTERTIAKKYVTRREENTVAIKEIIRDLGDEDITSDQFVGLVSVHTADRGILTSVMASTSPIASIYSLTFVKLLILHPEVYPNSCLFIEISTYEIYCNHNNSLIY